MKSLEFFSGIFVFLFLSCCSHSENRGTVGNHVETKSLESIEMVRQATWFLELFPDSNSDTCTINVEKYVKASFADSECIPLNFFNYLEGFIYQTRSESTGAKPILKIKVNKNTYLLIIVQQDDYGPIGYGLVFDEDKDSVTASIKVAEIWGDAGDSQISHSKIERNRDELVIRKKITTCHYDVDAGEDKPADEICNDSTAVFKLDKGLDFRLISDT